MKRPIYIDHNATTPLDPRVREAMLPYLGEAFGNPSSSHIYGQEAKQAVEDARSQVARLLSCEESEVVFTGGGSEANNLALKGVAFALRDKGDHLIVSSAEHPAILSPCRFLERQGFRVTYVPVDAYGMVDPGEVKRALTPSTILISIMHANNETGTLGPIAAIGEIAREAGVLFHTDAAQSVGKLPVSFPGLKVNLLTVAGHKLYAPKGVGALIVRKGLNLELLIHGAGQESGRRAGTENVAGIVGLGKACEVAQQELLEHPDHLRDLRDLLHRKLSEAIPDLALNGHPIHRLPNTLNVSFPDVDGEEMLKATPEIAASTGAACHSGRREPSSVLLAMGLSPARALSALRLTLGRFTTCEEVQEAAELLIRAYARVGKG